jgi:hypothetical protein
MWRYLSTLEVVIIPRAMVVDLSPLGSSVMVASFVVKSWTTIGRDSATCRSILFSFDERER